MTAFPPCVFAWQWRKEIIARINDLSNFRGADRVVTSTLDYRETLDRLLELYSKYSWQDRLIISPTGSKMQTVAVGIFRAFISDVQIVYPTPDGFVKPETYTVGVGSLHQLPLNSFASFKLN